MVRVQTYLRKVFGTKTLSVRARPKIKDSAEVYVGEDFVGTLTLDNEDGELCYQFQMAILELDLDGADAIGRDARSMALYELDGARVEMPADGRYWVARQRQLIGHVDLAPRMSASGSAAVIRGDNEPIRDRRQRLERPGRAACCTPTRAFPLTIGEDCTIGHHRHAARLHHRQLGSLIGIGAIVLNGARIGEQLHLSAPARSSPKGEVIPPGSIVLRLARQGRAPGRRTQDRAADRRGRPHFYAQRLRRFYAAEAPRTPA